MKIGRLTFSISLLAMLVAGCGGGSGGSSSGPSQPAPTYAIGGQLTGMRSPGVGLTLKLSTGESLKVLYDGTFAFAAQLAQGAAFQVSVETQPTGPDQICAVANSAGVVGSSNVAVTVTCTTPSVVNILVVNGTGQDRADGLIRGFVLNPATGTLTPKSAESAPGRASSIAYYPVGQQLYVSRWDITNPNYVDWGVQYQYTFDIYGVPKGQLLPGGGDQIAFNPTNGNLYGLTPGSLAQRPPARAPTYALGTVYPLFGNNAARDLISAPSFGRGLRRMAFDPMGKTIFVSADGDGQSDQAAILTLSLADPNTPVLGSSYRVRFLPYAVLARPSGRFLYATAPAESLAYMFTYDAAGSLSPLGSGSFPAPPNSRVGLVSSDGTRLYLVSYETGAIQCYAVGADGIPSARGTPVVAGTRPVDVTFDPDGKFLYVLNRGADIANSSISGYVVGNDCSLTAVSTSPVPAGTMATAITSARFTP